MSQRISKIVEGLLYGDSHYDLILTLLDRVSLYVNSTNLLMA